MIRPLRRESLPPLTFAGPACRASNDDPGPIGALWGRFFGEGGLARIAGRRDERLHALYCRYASDHTGPYTMILGCPVDAAAEQPEGVTSETLPASTYAVFDATGPQPDTLIATWQAIWGLDLPRTYTGDFDRHLDDERVEVFVAVRDTEDAA